MDRQQCLLGTGIFKALHGQLSSVGEDVLYAGTAYVVAGKVADFLESDRVMNWLADPPTSDVQELMKLPEDQRKAVAESWAPVLGCSQGQRRAGCPQPSQSPYGWFRCSWTVQIAKGSSRRSRSALAARRNSGSNHYVAIRRKPSSTDNGGIGRKLNRKISDASPNRGWHKDAGILIGDGGNDRL